VGTPAAYLATRAGGFNQWAFAILAMVTIAAAFLSLWHGEALKIAERVGESWIGRINADSEQHHAFDDMP